jgi:hypothetical protein
MNRLTILILAASVALAACETPGRTPPLEIIEVPIPMTVKCAEKLGPAPAYPDTPEALRAAPNIFERTKLLLRGRALRDARAAELTAAIAGCL